LIPTSFFQALGMINLMNIHAAQTIFAIGDDGSISVGLNYVIVGTKHFRSSSSFFIKKKT